MYQINFTYDDNTRRLAIDDTAVSTGDIDTDRIRLRASPSSLRGNVLHMVFRVRMPTGRGKVSLPVVKLRYTSGEYYWTAVIPAEVLSAIQHSPVDVQLRVGEAKHHYSINTVPLTASKAFIVK